jgi:hypothetical protein
MCVTVFYLHVAYILQLLFKRFQLFLQVFQMYDASVSTVFERMLQLFHLDILKVDRVLHLSLAFRYLASVSPSLSQCC